LGGAPGGADVLLGRHQLPGFALWRCAPARYRPARPVPPARRLFAHAWAVWEGTQPHLSMQRCFLGRGNTLPGT